MLPINFDDIYKKIKGKSNRINNNGFEDLTIIENYNKHAKLIGSIANLILQPEKKVFIFDDNNKLILKFLTYYFNGCELALDIFPEENYTLSKQIILCGPVGSGKTIIMKIFSEYLRLTANPLHFNNVSVTQMINYYKINNHLDRYIYNEANSLTFEGNPFNICLNDLGLETHKHYGTDTQIMVNDFLHARNEIFINHNKVAHITTNLTVNEIKEQCEERLIDRFKTYNIINLKGNSKR